jgi:hypothetical protein
MELFPLTPTLSRQVETEKTGQSPFVEEMREV